MNIFKKKILSPKQQYDRDRIEMIKDDVKNRRILYEFSWSWKAPYVEVTIQSTSDNFNYFFSIYRSWDMGRRKFIWNWFFISDRYYYDILEEIRLPMLNELSIYCKELRNKENRLLQTKEDEKYLKKLNELKNNKPLDSDLKQRFDDAKKIIDYWYEIKAIERKILNLRNK